MLVSVYRSPLKDQMYLYLPKRDDFSALPDKLLKTFGKPEFALQLNLAKRDKLSRVNINDVMRALEDIGYYLQLPPTIDNNINYL